MSELLWGLFWGAFGFFIGRFYLISKILRWLSGGWPMEPLEMSDNRARAAEIIYGEGDDLLWEQAVEIVDVLIWEGLIEV